MDETLGGVNVGILPALPFDGVDVGRTWLFTSSK